MGKVIAFNRNPRYDDRIVEFFEKFLCKVTKNKKHTAACIKKFFVLWNLYKNNC